MFQSTSRFVKGFLWFRASLDALNPLQKKSVFPAVILPPTALTIKPHHGLRTDSPHCRARTGPVSWCAFSSGPGIRETWQAQANTNHKLSFPVADVKVWTWGTLLFGLLFFDICMNINNLRMFAFVPLEICAILGTCDFAEEDEWFFASLRSSNRFQC